MGGFAHHIWSVSWYFTIKLLLDSPFEPSKTSQRQSLQKTGKIRWEYKKFSANLSLLSHIKKTGTNFVTKFHKIQCMWQTVWITWILIMICPRCEAENYFSFFQFEQPVSQQAVWFIIWSFLIKKANKLWYTDLCVWLSWPIAVCCWKSPS